MLYSHISSWMANSGFLHNALKLLWVFQSCNLIWKRNAVGTRLEQKVAIVIAICQFKTASRPYNYNGAYLRQHVEVHKGGCDYLCMCTIICWLCTFPCQYPTNSKANTSNYNNIVRIMLEWLSRCKDMLTADSYYANYRLTYICVCLRMVLYKDLQAHCRVLSGIYIPTRAYD